VPGIGKVTAWKLLDKLTGLPLTLRPLEFWQLAHRSQPYENPFCAMIAQTKRGCAAYLETEQRTVDVARSGPATVRCFAGLCHTAVPIKLGERAIGFLQTGQVALEMPSAAGFEPIARQLTDWGVSVDMKSVQDAYARSRVFSQDQYAGFIRWNWSARSSAPKALVAGAMRLAA
jgi:hypothetical protein